MSGDPWFTRVQQRLEIFSWLALAGIFFIAVGAYFREGALAEMAIVLGVLMISPLLFYLVLVPIWHWKARYRGQHDLLWGALLVIETSGVFKIVYWLRHIIPDWRGTGRYARTRPAQPST